MKTFKLSYTEKEMLEAKDVCLNFDLNQTAQLAKQIGKKRIIFTGMGSSMIFPAKQAKNRALHYNLSNKIEAYFASDLLQYTDFFDTYLFLCSNSGQTKEVIHLLEHAKKHGGHCISVTTTPDSELAKRCDKKIVLSCGVEKGVAATKTVIEQALVYDSLIFHLAEDAGKNILFSSLKKELADTGEKIVRNVNLQLLSILTEQLANAKHLFFAGLETGVAEEIALKAYEITRKMALFFPDTHIVHGVEEAINKDVAVIFDSNYFDRYKEDFYSFSKRTGCLIVGVDKNSSIWGPEILINETFRNYCLLATGWGILRNVARYMNLDIDHPKRAAKVGNPIEGR